MRSCPKCGSYVPEGKILCPACGRINVGLVQTLHDSTLSEKRRTQTRIADAFEQVKRDAPWLREEQNPFAGGTYEQHKSHDYRSEDYYKPKYEASAENTAVNNRIVCAAAYFGILFLVPLLVQPKSEEARFHANQGLVLFLFGLVLGVFADAVALVLGDFFQILQVMLPLLMVYGASNAMKGNMTELPVIGKLRLIKDDFDIGGLR